MSTKTKEQYMKEAFKNLKEFGEFGARNTRKAIKTVKKINVKFSPLSLPLKLITNEFKKETTASSVELIGSVLELIESDVGQSTLQIIYETLNWAIDLLKKFVEEGTRIGGLQGVINRFSDPLYFFKEMLKT